MKNKETIPRLEKLALKKNTSLCHTCCCPVQTKRCVQCGSDDLIREPAGEGVGLGTFHKNETKGTIIMSHQWISAHPGDQKRYVIIARIFESNPKLIQFLFHPTKAELAMPVKKLLQNSYSTGENILIRIAIDLWNGSGKALLMDLEQLDIENLKRVIEALLLMRKL